MTLKWVKSIGIIGGTFSTFTTGSYCPELMHYFRILIPCQTDNSYLNDTPMHCRLLNFQEPFTVFLQVTYWKQKGHIVYLKGIKCDT